MNDIIVIGGPNGAGKTTAATVLLPAKLGMLEFVNADSIAQGLSPFNPAGVALPAGRAMLGRMHELARAATAFAFETTCAGRVHARFLHRRQAEGWRITLLFLWLPDPQLALQRVARRVAEGGHNVPAAVIIRRYWSGLRNLIDIYLPLADTAHIYDSPKAGVLIAGETRKDSLIGRDGSFCERWLMKDMTDEELLAAIASAMQTVFARFKAERAKVGDTSVGQVNDPLPTNTP